ncbi:hypothetical protein L596_004728 [Steinernema carpocapsae]|uniref:Caveolin n=1 Tax=Steinernema carpocapsae TaxID=34508 RepID=A0A4U8UYB2_STECR|nr:hypothetical protein L596_004728 [Steinernema carpocapsae]
MATEKVELEQVPLKSDTDAPAESEQPAEVTTDVDAEVQKPVEPKKKWYHFKKGGAQKEEKAEGEYEAEPEGETETEQKEKEKDEPKKAQRKWWQRANCDQKQKKEVVEPEGIQFGLDMVHRDEHNINDHVAITFEDIFGEPDAVHSFDCVWRLTNKVFNFFRLFFYRFISFVIAIPAAIVFGILFAFINAFSVFCCTPAGRLLSIPVFWIAKIWSVVVHAIVDPISSAFRAKNSVQVGFSSAPTADHIA